MRGEGGQQGNVDREKLLLFARRRLSGEAAKVRFVLFYVSSGNCPCKTLLGRGEGGMSVHLESRSFTSPFTTPGPNETFRAINLRVRCQYLYGGPSPVVVDYLHAVAGC